MDHQAKDAHLSGTAVVKLDGEFAVQGLLVPARGFDLSGFNIVFAGSKATFNEGNGQEGAEDGISRKSGEGSQTSRDLGEIGTRGDGFRDAVTSGGHDVAEDGKLGNAAVLGLNLTKAVEFGLVGTLQEVKRIPETKRCLGTNLGFEGHLQDGTTCHTGRGGEGGSTDDGSKDNNGTEHLIMNAHTL